jgi:hypothetical protein
VSLRFSLVLILLIAGILATFYLTKHPDAIGRGYEGFKAYLEQKRTECPKDFYCVPITEAPVQ